MAGKNASGNESVAELIAWYERETAVSRDDPVSRWPWAFGRFSDGAPVEERQRWIYRERPDLQEVFPDPYDNAAGGLTLAGWCATEGRIRFPGLFAKDASLPQDVRAPGPGVSLVVGLRLLVLLFAPRAGKSLRARLLRLLKREGLAGVAHRLRSSPGG
jgi:hypothetical protein